MKTIQNSINIISFTPSLAADFKRLNLAWLQKYFVVEAIDNKVLNDPANYIINQGGYIYFAIKDGQVAGTAALIKTDAHIFELSKMAVDESFQGQQVGNHLLKHCIDSACMLGAHKLVLYSNTRLLPALHLYRKYGFAEVPLGTSVYKRSDIKMEKDLR
jgi:N-acetylglutamate synthase-like GNAT family acetyltransferase